MSKSWLCASVTVFALSSCGKGDKPAGGASDGQFKAMDQPKNAFRPPVPQPSTSRVVRQQFNGLKFSASERFVGIGAAENRVRLGASAACVPDRIAGKT